MRRPSARIGTGQLIRALGLGLGLWTLACLPALAEPLSEHDWRADLAALGGLSGVVISRDGGALLALSDRGTLLQGTITREGGAITGITLGDSATLLRADGSRSAERGDHDSEGLAIGPDGAIWISYEGDPRVVRHAPDGRVIGTAPRNPAFDALPVNGALEGLALDAEGTIFTLAEDGAAGPAPLYRLLEDGWDDSWRFPREDGFKPVGLDFDGAGRLYVLERGFRIFWGFTSRIRRFGIGADGPGPGEVLLETPAGRHGNLEGISLWRDAGGRLIATMVADDNFLFFLDSAVVEYALPD